MIVGVSIWNYLKSSVNKYKETSTRVVHRCVKTNIWNKLSHKTYPHMNWNLFHVYFLASYCKLPYFQFSWESKMELSVTISKSIIFVQFILTDMPYGWGMPGWLINPCYMRAIGWIFIEICLGYTWGLIEIYLRCIENTNERSEICKGNAWDMQRLYIWCA